jgi:hypothetical protein
MSLRFRPRLDSLEARDVPAALSFRLPDGTLGSGLFGTPGGVDPAQASQTFNLDDLSVTKGGAAYTVQSGATASYAYGVLVGVSAVANGADTITLSSGWAQVTGSGLLGPTSAPVVYDGADTMATFTLPDGTTGSLSYTIPWDQVDSSQASQSLTPAAFNLNIGGQNFAYGSASYTTAPTLLFANGEFVGVNFALDTSLVPGFAYSSLAMGGLNVTAIQSGTGQQFFTLAAPKVSMLSFGFGECGAADYTYSLRAAVTYANGTVKQVDISVEKGTTASGLRDMIQVALKAEGVDAVVQGENLVLKGTEANNLKTVSFQATKDPNAILKPSILKIKQEGRLSTADITPTWTAREVNP